MHILVINSGSSSVKFSVFETQEDVNLLANPRCVIDGELSHFGETGAKLRFSDANGKNLRGASGIEKAKNLVDATVLIFDSLMTPGMPAIDAIGYRVVHPGPKLQGHQRITEEVLKDLQEAAVFAPLHDPEALMIIREGLKRFPDIPQFACFDTVFHNTMPESAFVYPIPASFREQGVQRYGFHGLSCESIVRSMRAGGAKLPKRMVIAHLGSGCSVTALIDGCSIDTTMGLTPAGGVVMGTRSGDLDPGLLLYLLRQELKETEGIDKVEAMLNHRSGLVGMTGLPNDMQTIRKAANDGNPKAILALAVFTRSITKAIGGFSWLMGGLDAIIFSGGIGEHDVFSRTEILTNLENAGVLLDRERNASPELGLQKISTSDSKTAIFIVPSQEDLMIAVHVSRLMQPAN